MKTHEEILVSLIAQLRERLEVNGETEAKIKVCLEQLTLVANDYHLPNQPDDVLQDLVNPTFY